MFINRRVRKGGSAGGCRCGLGDMEEEHLTKFDLGDLEHLVETDDFTIFNQDDLPVGGFQVMEDIRRKGKLCDVTLKVGGGARRRGNTPRAACPGLSQVV